MAFPKILVNCGYTEVSRETPLSLMLRRLDPRCYVCTYVSRDERELTTCSKNRSKIKSIFTNDISLNMKLFLPFFLISLN